MIVSLDVCPFLATSGVPGRIHIGHYRLQYCHYLHVKIKDRVLPMPWRAYFELEQFSANFGSDDNKPQVEVYGFSYTHARVLSKG